ncbi:unnamed protein product [Mytilus coruscus]|uniref:DDE Tnp4 domain-containing protein n=1 Tax=Mytilus coruscus TaxID=42192 RepID=A0A6J8EWW6_MYTCO|nr:unnamed protein product [Mytilus coruscus]
METDVYGQDDNIKAVREIAVSDDELSEDTTAGRSGTYVQTIIISMRKRTHCPNGKEISSTYDVVMLLYNYCRVLSSINRDGGPYDRYPFLMFKESDMPPKSNYFKCVLCSKCTKPKERATVNKDITKYLRRKFLIEAKNGDIICNKCRHIFRKERDQKVLPCVKTSKSSSQTTATFSPPSVSLKIPSTSKSNAYCCICKKPGPKLIVISPDVRTATYVDNNILIPSGNRCCPSHICEGHLNDDALCRIKTTDESFVNRTYLLEIMNKMRKKIRESASRRLNFDDSNLSEPDYITMTGLSKINFSEVCSTLSKYLKNTPARTITTTVAIFLCKLKSGMSNRFLSTIFCVSKSSVRRAFNSVRQAFMSEFVPANLGFQHISREEIIQKHTRPLAQSMFGGIASNSAILVLDGTYIYVDKSNNFHFQRRSYSTHKGRALVKPMIVCTTTGYYVSVLGPYLADYRNNDASILTHMLKTNVEEIRDWVNEEDILFLDRGFRDAIPLFRRSRIQAEMPRFLKKGDKQFSTEDANMSRLVTKIRWIVESSNARIKTWKYLSHTLPTNQIPFIGDFVRIVCALSNKYAPPLSQCTDVESDQLEAAKMIHLSKMSNTLKEHVETENLLKKKLIWKVASECDLENFPRLDDQELRNITCGVYQMKLASSYIQEYTDEESDIFVHREDSNLLRIKIQSRHTSSKKHQLWIRYNESYIDSWYCLLPSWS